MVQNKWHVLCLIYTMLPLFKRDHHTTDEPIDIELIYRSQLRFYIEMKQQARYFHTEISDVTFIHCSTKIEEKLKDAWNALILPGKILSVLGTMHKGMSPRGGVKQEKF